MGLATAIEWCDSTLNLEMGCDGCELWNPKVGEKSCYAGVLHERYAGVSAGYPASFDKPKLFPGRLGEAAKWADLTGKTRPGKPWLNGMPRLVFLDDMGDTFTESLPIDWLAPHLSFMAGLPFIFILLTKRANRMLEFSKTHPFPENFWLLVSVTSAANYNRIEQLMCVRGGSVFGVSYEPAWGPADFVPWLPISRDDGSCSLCGFLDSQKGHSVYCQSPHLSWLVAGGQSGPNSKAFDLAWARSTIAQCKAANVSCFVKQLGANPFYRPTYPNGNHKGEKVFLDLRDKKGGDWNEWSEDLRVREFPDVRQGAAT